MSTSLEIEVKEADDMANNFLRTFKAQSSKIEVQIITSRCTYQYWRLEFHYKT